MTDYESRIHVFTSNGSYFPPQGVAGHLVNLYVVLRGAGGGAGLKGGGGGGAAVITRRIYSMDLSKTNGVFDPISVTVGAPGAGGNSGTKGGDSIFGNFVCPGGEGGSEDGELPATGGISFIRGGSGGYADSPHGESVSSSVVRLLAGGGGGGFPGGPGLGNGGSSGLILGAVGPGVDGSGHPEMWEVNQSGSGASANSAGFGGNGGFPAGGGGAGSTGGGSGGAGVVTVVETVRIGE